MDNILRFSEDGKTLVKVVDKSVTSITIPDGVTEIGYEAFMLCKSLEEINIPDSITKTGEMAFASCTSLKGKDKLVERVSQNLQFLL